MDSDQAACPRCGAKLEQNQRDRARPASFPFCSERCKLLDLGAWAAEKYRIAGPQVTGESRAGEEEGGD